MSFEDYKTDKYEQYETLFDPMLTDRQARRKRKAKVNHIPKKEQEAIIEEIADTTGIEGGFRISYQPARYEEGWLLSSLQAFYYEALISDVLAVVKGGKEASVYRCAAHEGLKADFLAVKVYRPRQFRNLRNDGMYREGRSMLGTEGKALQERDKRLKQALRKGTNFGAQMKHTSWLMYEFTTLQTLYDLGAAVPKPYAVSDNAILMEYCGNDRMAAPTLHEIDLEPDEAKTLFKEVLRNIELMLAHNLIHGDLSAYNILYWEGEITLIDFPQVVNSQGNIHAYKIFCRDIERVCEYFIRQGVACNPAKIIEDLWTQYAALAPELQAADESRFEEIEEEM